MQYSEIVLYPIIAIFCSLLLYFPVKIMAKKFNIVDLPNERKIHTAAMPRIGGLMIFSAFIILYFVSGMYTNLKEPLNVSKSLFITAFVSAFLLGFIDDIFGIRAVVKLFFQIALGVLIAYSGLIIKEISIFGTIYNLGYLSYLVTTIWVVAIINAVNLIDGMDGLASGILIIAFSFTFVISVIEANYYLALISGILTGSTIGFYLFNFPPAKIFMGDGGAYFLGAMYAMLPLFGLKKTSMAIMLAIPLVLLILPLTDIIYLFVRRAKLNKNPFKADKNHIHHRLLSIGFTVRQINILIYLVSIILGLISVLIALSDGKFGLLFFFVILLLVFAGFWVIRILEKGNTSNRKI